MLTLILTGSRLQTCPSFLWGLQGARPGGSARCEGVSLPGWPGPLSRGEGLVEEKGA